MNDLSQENELSHVRPDGSAHMVDVTDKTVTSREASARAVLRTRADVVARIADGDLPKGRPSPPPGSQGSWAPSAPPS